MACNAGRASSQRPATRCRSNRGQHAQRAGPDISRLEPALQQQWDHAANAHVGNIELKPHSAKKVWWTCNQCPDGHLHRWEACVSARTKGSGCPQCCGRKVCKHNSLTTKAPLVAAQWDHEANDASPDSVVAQSNRYVGWHCDACGHKWITSPNQRLNKQSGCPQCARADARSCNKVKQPTFAQCTDSQVRALLAQWDHPRNAEHGHFPDKITLQSHKKIFWLCNKCPAGKEHSWPAMPNKRAGRNQSGCPFCAGHAACSCNSLEALYPAVAADWDSAKNQGQPSDHTAGSTYLAWWSSLQRGSWQQSIHSRTKQLPQGPARLKRHQQRQKSAIQS